MTASEEAFALLEVRRLDAPTDEIRKRMACQEYVLFHPDAGGSNEGNDHV